jgi:EmrB/QacA subfamily drug resistance transporter
MDSIGLKGKAVPVQRTKAETLVLVGCILGSVIVFLDQTAVSVALPAIRSDLDTNLASQQWIVVSYLLTLGSLILVGGSLGDILGRKRIFLAGLVGFGIASAACAIAPTTEFLIGSRALQGAAGALLVPSSLALITQTFSDEKRGWAIGMWTAWTGIAFVAGPLCGGALVDLSTWRLVFAINLPLIAINVFVINRALPGERKMGSLREIDWIGALLSAIGLAGVVYALIEQPQHGWTTETVFSLAVGVAAISGFVLREVFAKKPMVPLGIFSERNFSVANLATLTIYAGLAAATFFIVIYLQQIDGYDPITAGLALIPVTVLMWLLSPRFGKLASRVGPRLLMGVGPIIAGLGLLWLSRIGPSVDYMSDVFPGAILFGVGLSMTVAPLTTTVLSALPQERAGIASGTNNAIARIAALLAVAVIGAIVATTFSHSLTQHADAAAITKHDRGLIQSAKDQPLVKVKQSEHPSRVLQKAVLSASSDGFRSGLEFAAGLVILGGIVSLIGIVNPSRPRPQPG